MKPRTKLEKLVTELSGKLPAITKEQEDWAKKHLFDHFAYKCKDELWCSECGKMWVNTSKDKLGDKIECPYCHHQLDVKVSRKQKIHEEAYMSILQVKGGFQVIRHIHHCVYQNGYYRRPECLILSAKDTAGKRLETIEVNLNTLDIVQSRSFCNGVSEYHDQIVKLVKKNINLIRRKMIA